MVTLVSIAGISSIFSAGRLFVFVGWQNCLNFSYQKIVPLDGQTRLAKSALLPVNLPTFLYMEKKKVTII